MAVGTTAFRHSLRALPRHDVWAASEVLRNTWGIAIDVSTHREPGTLGLEQRADEAVDRPPALHD